MNALVQYRGFLQSLPVKQFQEQIEYIEWNERFPAERVVIKVVAIPPEHIPTNGGLLAHPEPVGRMQVNNRSKQVGTRRLLTCGFFEQNAGGATGN